MFLTLDAPTRTVQVTGRMRIADVPCWSMADYEKLPNVAWIGDSLMAKTAWHSDRKVARYQSQVSLPPMAGRY